MASIQARVSRGKKYWSIVESRRINGKPRTIILEYLGTAETLLERVRGSGKGIIKSYSHGDTAALLKVSEELNVINIINNHVKKGHGGRLPIRDGMTVGASVLLAAIGRACSLTSKRGWYDWCKETSLEYCIGRSLKHLDSQHFWDQMHALPETKIKDIEQEILQRLIELYKPDIGDLLFDTTNFFTFIDSTNTRCSIAKRGKNKQKRGDLRQFGLALVVSRKEQFPLFHKVYEGNKNDITVFKETFSEILSRLKELSLDLLDITLIFDKGNNSKANFALIDEENSIRYIGSLSPSHFKHLINEANQNFQELDIEGEKVPSYRTLKDIWGKKRTCVVFLSDVLRQGQIQGVIQVLEKKRKELDKFQKVVNGRKKFTFAQIEERIRSIIHGQFVSDIIKFEITSTNQFSYYFDESVFTLMKESIFGRQILVTNQETFSTEEIIKAYKAKTKVEYSFRCLKNPFHLAIRPQFHWTDQKIKVHAFICVLSYILAFVVFNKAKRQAQYPHDIKQLLEDLRTIRLASTVAPKGSKVSYQLERIVPKLKKLANSLAISDHTIRPKNRIQ